eukprot:TRINITY_DN8997_c2_g1_i1.p1 TRINITY_DN8997_c2_g1~~TRINITY_DN8997_c2_g1_i1.p1  ORF type:complete len:161 (+),score=47.12 TRINITY_DN8997_c2_g1_i1:30-485(+)
MNFVKKLSGSIRNSLATDGSTDCSTDMEGEEWLRQMNGSGVMSLAMMPRMKCEGGTQTEPRLSVEREMRELKEEVSRLRRSAEAARGYYVKKDSIIETQRALILELQHELSMARKLPSLLSPMSSNGNYMDAGGASSSEGEETDEEIFVDE